MGSTPFEPSLPPATNCFYCGEGLEKPKRNNSHTPYTATIDHVVARRNGGLGKLNNRVWSCHWCNNSKGNKSVENWVLWLRNQPHDLSAVAARKRRKVIGRWMDGKIVAPVTNSD